MFAQAINRNYYFSELFHCWTCVVEDTEISHRFCIFSGIIGLFNKEIKEIKCLLIVLCFCLLFPFLLYIFIGVLRADHIHI